MKIFRRLEEDGERLTRHAIDKTAWPTDTHIVYSLHTPENRMPQDQGIGPLIDVQCLSRPAFAIYCMPGDSRRWRGLPGVSVRLTWLTQQYRL